MARTLNAGSRRAPNHFPINHHRQRPSAQAGGTIPSLSNNTPSATAGGVATSTSSTGTNYPTISIEITREEEDTCSSSPLPWTSLSDEFISDDEENNASPPIDFDNPFPDDDTFDDENSTREPCGNEPHHQSDDNLDPLGSQLLMDIREQRSCDHPFFSVDQTAMIELITHFNKAGTSIKIFDQTLELITKHMRKGFDPKKAPKRQTFLKSLHKKVSAPLPQMSVSPLHNIPISHFHIRDQIQSLLTSKYFAEDSYCMFNSNAEQIFQPYKLTEESSLSEVVQGKWYQNTSSDYLENHGVTFFQDGVLYHNLLFPLIFYNDRTGGSSQMGGYSLEPLMFTCGLIKREFREDATAWRHLGFLPKSNKIQDGKLSLETYHDCLSLLLGPLEELQKKPPLMQVKLFGSKEKINVRLLLPVAFVMGDQPSQDQHCGKKKNYSGTSSRVHRGCMCSVLEASNPDHQCKPMSKKVIDSLMAAYMEGRKGSEEQKQLVARVLDKPRQKALTLFLESRSAMAATLLETVYSMHTVANAWSRIDFGANKDGILRATLDDPMHYFDLGVFDYLTNTSFGILVDSEKKKVEGWMRAELGRKRSSVKEDFPAGKYHKGFSGCTLLTARQRIGNMLGLYLALGSVRFQSVYGEALKRQQDKYLQLLKMSLQPDVTPEYQHEKLFFADVRREESVKNNSPTSKLPRNIEGVKAVLTDVYTLGLGGVIEADLELFDELQVELLCVNIWQKFTQKRLVRVEGAILSFEPTVAITSGEREELGCHPVCPHLIDNHASHIFQKLRKPKLTVVPRKRKRQQDPTRETTSLGLTVDDGQASTPTIVVEKLIPKHGLVACHPKSRKKSKTLPQVKGATSCILTPSVTDFRNVIQAGLVFHALVHEYHFLDSKIQMDLNTFADLAKHLQKILLVSVFRGNDTIDMATTKSHCASHLARDVEYYGAPMNFDAGLGERGLKLWAKAASLTARKCGEQVFLQQTIDRVSTGLLLQKSMEIIEDARVVKPPPPMLSENWKFIRKQHHMTLDLLTGNTSVHDVNNLDDSRSTELVTPKILEALRQAHDNKPSVISIWKEAIVKLTNKGGGHHFVRAFHEYNQSGQFFDFVYLRKRDRKGKHTKDVGIPAMAVLLYEHPDDGPRALCWPAITPQTKADLENETNISSQYRMKFDLAGYPVLESYPMSWVAEARFVFANWPDYMKLGALKLPGHSVQAEKRPLHVITLLHPRFDWASNYLDKSRWEEHDETGGEESGKNILGTSRDDDSTTASQETPCHITETI